MKAILIKTDCLITEVELFKPLWKAVHPVLGGYMEVVHPVNLPQPFIMLANEEGLFLNLPLNPIASVLYGTPEHGQPIVGDVIIMKEAVVNQLGEHDIVGIDYDIPQLLRMLMKLKHEFGL